MWLPTNGMAWIGCILRLKSKGIGYRANLIYILFAHGGGDDVDCLHEMIKMLVVRWLVYMDTFLGQS